MPTAAQLEAIGMAPSRAKAASETPSKRKYRRKLNKARPKADPNRHKDTCECGELKRLRSLRCRKCAYAFMLGAPVPGYKSPQRNLDQCECGEPKTKRSRQCKKCAAKVRRGVPRAEW